MAGGNNSLGYLRQINEKMDRLLAIAERYVGVPVAVGVFVGVLEGVEASERPKIEKQIRDLQPKIKEEIDAGILLESEFQSQYDGVLSQLTYEGLKPVMRAKMEKIRNDLKAKLNAEKEHGIARGGSKKRKRKSSKKTKSRRN